MDNRVKFTFVDLFAGIGGFHIAMHNLGGKCVFVSEMDVHARKTYQHNFQKISPEIFKNNLFNNDIRNITPSDIPDFDILCAGFPCQPFSQAGQKRGFNDNHNSERGNLFFNIAEIIDVKRPKAFFLENVRGILKHDNGNTFKVIRNILESELGYSFYFKVVKACDYGLPQLRPRAFMVGFRDEGFMRGFIFPPKKALKLNMSDVWEGDCSREIGFTLRVGGRGSKIDDRRNWDSYLVNGEVKRLEAKQGKRMQGFPEDYEFPVSDTQAIKQLGNSVAIDAVQEVASQMIKYLQNIELSKPKMKDTKNKGEWSELLVFLKLLTEQKLFLSDEELNPKTDYFNIRKVTTKNIGLEYFIVNKSTIEISDKKSKDRRIIDTSKILNKETLQNLVEEIKKSRGTFVVSDFDIIKEALGFSVFVGGTRKQKSDILLDISNKSIEKNDEGFSIKSFLGGKPTLLNASGNTNFIFEIKGINSLEIDNINGINTKTKLKDRITLIEKLGGSMIYVGAERENMNHNLKIVDSLMPNIIGHILLSFYKKRISKIEDIVEDIHNSGLLNKEIRYGDLKVLEIKIKKLLVDYLLGFFPGEKWDGEYESNGTIVIKNSGDCVGFHIIDLKSLKDYLFKSVKLDTPSTTRHRFGNVYKEKGGKLYFKLNLQLRF